MSAFICVGGPLDGKWKAQVPGQMSFEVVQRPSPSRFAVFSPEESAAPCNDVAKHHRYVLQEHHVHGAAWVLQPMQN